MSDVERYIEKRKKQNPHFAKDYESGYQIFEFSVMLREARERAGVTQESIAKKLCTRNLPFRESKTILKISAFQPFTSMRRLSVSAFAYRLPNNNSKALLTDGGSRKRRGTSKSRFDKFDVVHQIVVESRTPNNGSATANVQYAQNETSRRRRASARLKMRAG